MSRTTKNLSKYYSLFALFTLFSILNFYIIQTIIRWSDTKHNKVLLLSPRKKWQFDNNNISKEPNHLLSMETMHKNNENNSVTFNQECFEYIYVDFYESHDRPIPRSCSIQYNATYSIHFAITETILNFLHVIESLNEWDKGAKYIIKSYPLSKPIHYEEFAIMAYLTQFCTETDCHTIRVSDNHYPLIDYKHNNGKSFAIIVMQYLSNTIKYRDFEKSLWRYYGVEETLHFIDTCFANVSVVLDQLWAINLLHNDWHKENILVSDTHSHECYLIDFNQMFRFVNETHSDTKEYRGILSSLSPMHWNYLSTHEMRSQFMDTNAFEKLKQFGFASQRFKVNILILNGLLKSKAIQALSDDNNEEFGKYITKYVYSTIVDNDDRRYHLNTSDLAMYEKLQNIWCCRMEQIVYIIPLLKEYKQRSYARNNVNVRNILQSMFELYHQLQDELDHFGIVCQTCVLIEKYQNLENVRPENVKYALSL